MRKLLLSGAFLAASFIGGVPAAWADDHAEIDTIELVDLLDYESVSNPQISPDGTSILYTRSRVDAVKDRLAHVGNIQSAQDHATIVRRTLTTVYQATRNSS